MKKIWMRLGVTLLVTEKEAEVLLPDANGNWDAEESKKVLERVLKRGCFTPDGDSYIPATEIEQYNQDNGTNHSDAIEPQWDI